MALGKEKKIDQPPVREADRSCQLSYSGLCFQIWGFEAGYEIYSATIDFARDLLLKGLELRGGALVENIWGQTSARAPAITNAALSFFTGTVPNILSRVESRIPNPESNCETAHWLLRRLSDQHRQVIGRQDIDFITPLSGKELEERWQQHTNPKGQADLKDWALRGRTIEIPGNGHGFKIDVSFKAETESIRYGSFCFTQDFGSQDRRCHPELAPNLDLIRGQANIRGKDILFSVPPSTIKENCQHRIFGRPEIRIKNPQAAFSGPSGWETLTRIARWVGTLNAEVENPRLIRQAVKANIINANLDVPLRTRMAGNWNFITGLICSPLAVTLASLSREAIASLDKGTFNLLAQRSYGKTDVNIHSLGLLDTYAAFQNLAGSSILTNNLVFEMIRAAETENPSIRLEIIADAYFQTAIFTNPQVFQRASLLHSSPMLGPLIKLLLVLEAPGYVNDFIPKAVEAELNHRSEKTTAAAWK